MVRMRVSAALAVMILSSVWFVPSRARAQSSSSSADTAAVRQAVTDFVDAFNRHDAHAWSMCFAEDGDFTNVTGLTRHGRKEIEERFTGLFAAGLKNAHRTVNMRHVRFIRPDVAAVDADWVLTGSRAADGSENPERKGIFIFVMTKQNGKWLFDVFDESEFISLK